MGFMTTLYTRTLFARDNGDFLPKSQYSCLNFRSICFLFFAICYLQFSFPSICIPKYFSGINMLLRKTGGQVQYETQLCGPNQERLTNN
jgi:hypothetical protein